MYDYEYYYEQEPSEIDLLVADTVNKIKKTILLKAKDDVEAETQKAAKVQEQFDIYKANSERAHKSKAEFIQKLQDELKNLTVEYNKKRTEIPTVDFDIGEKVFYITYDYEDKVLKCPTCNGTGKITCTLDEYGEVQADCPHCHGMTWGNGPRQIYKYHFYYPRQEEITKIHLTISNEGMQTRYMFRNGHDDKNVYKDRATCQAECDRLNQQALAEAQTYIYQGE